MNAKQVMDPASDIRLLKILSAKEGRLVECELSMWPLANPPPYIGISYTWGSAANTASIILNGKETVVRTNCEYVLQQVSSLHPDRYIWLDALCIDQTNNVEKSVQVAMMGEIYKAAELVLSCVGPPDEDSRRVMQMFRDNDSIYSHATARLIKEFLADDGPRDVPFELKLRSEEWLAQNCPDVSQAVRLIQALNRFFDRPYFSRLWAVQEVGMARDVHICCGLDMIPFRSLQGHYSLMNSLFVHRDDSGAQTREIQRALIPEVAFKRLPLVDCRPIDHVPGKGISFHANLIRIRNLECDNLMDLIYGTLSLVDWTGMPRIVPDYQKSAFQLALDLLSEDYAIGDDLDFRADWLVEHLRLNEKNPNVLRRRKALSSSVSSGTGSPNIDDRFRIHISVTSFDNPRQKGRDTPPAAMTSAVSALDRFHCLIPELATVQNVCLLPSMYDFPDTCYFIARQQDDKYFELLGYIRPDSPRLIDGSPGVEFFFDPEDLLMVAALNHSWRNVWIIAEGIEAQVGRVCREPGSSYAVLEEEEDYL